MHVGQDLSSMTNSLLKTTAVAEGTGGPPPYNYYITNSPKLSLKLVKL